MNRQHETQTIAQILSGDNEKYRLLVERYHKGLIIYLYNLLHDEEQAEDIAQEAFLQAYKKLDQFKPVYAFSTWLYKIAYNLSLRYLQQTKRTTQIDEIEQTYIDVSQERVEEIYKREEDKAAVRKAITTLKPNYQQIVALYYWENLSYEEIAFIIEKPIGTVRTWLRRAKADLRKELYEQF